MSELLSFLKSYRLQAIVGSIFKFFEVITELLLPSVMIIVINDGILKSDLNVIYRMGGLMILLSICGLVFAFICQYCAAYTAQSYGTDVRNHIFDHVMKLKVKEWDRLMAPSLTVRLTHDIQQVQWAVALTIRLVSRVPFILLGSLMMAFMINSRLAIILLMATPVLAFVIFRVSRSSSPEYRNYQEHMDHFSSLVKENSDGSKIIRVFNSEERANAGLQALNHGLYDSGLRISKITAWFNPLSSLVINCVVLAILWVSQKEINAMHIDAGEVVALMNYVYQILAALLVFSNLVLVFTRALVSSKRLTEVLALEKEENNDGIEKESTVLYAFENASFRYLASEKNVLNELNFEIHEGEKIGIIGRTGSGKSSLVKLLLSLYELNEGELFFKGIRIEESDKKRLRKKVRMVFQNPDLLSGTIASNIRFENETLSDEAVADAVKMAQLEESIVQFPEGIHHPIEHLGRNVSGGQRQRIALARAFAAQPEILILDDSTSALDYQTEMNVLEALKRASWLKNLIIVSQRISSIEDCDRILVLKSGEVAGFDDHEKLLESCEEYQNIYASQRKGDEHA